MNIVRRESEEDLLMDLYLPNIIKGLDADEIEDGKFLERIKDVDGAGSGIDADMVDGYHAAAFLLRDASLSGRVAAVGNGGEITDGGSYEEFEQEFLNKIPEDLR